MKKLSALMLAMACSLGLWAQQESASEGLHTSGLKILDSKNNELVMRGVNYSWAWQRGHEETVIPKAKEIGCNAIRIQLSTGLRKKEGKYDWERCTPDDLRKLIKLCEDNKLIAVFNTHDETGETDESYLRQAVDFWIEMKDILNDHLSTVIVNVSNEWMGLWDDWNWAKGYQNQIPRLRDAGIKNLLLVDCAGWGQYPDCIWKAGYAVAEADKLNNIAMAIHFYEYAGGSSQKVRDNIYNALYKWDGGRSAVPLVIGEFAYAHKDGPVAWQEILSYTYEHHVGYLAWSWTGNGEGAEMCDLFTDFSGDNYAESGRLIIPNEYGIPATSVECSFFDDKYGVNDPSYVALLPVNGESGGGGNTSSGSTDFLWEGTWTMLWEGGEDFQYQPGENNFKNNEMQGLEIGDKLVFSYKDLGSNPQFQLVVKYGSDWTWTEVIPYAPIVDGKYTYEITDAEVPGYPGSSMVATLREHGFVIKGNDATLVRIELVKKNGGSTTDPTPGDDYDPSIEEPLPDDSSKWVTDVTIADNIDCSFDGSWGNSYHVRPEQLGVLRKGDKIHLYFSNTGGGSQLQVAYMDGSKWTEFHSCKDINNATQEDIEVNNTDSHPRFIRGVNSDGIYVKGQNYKLDRVAVSRREDISLGIDNARMDGAEMFDFDAPFEIYTIDGRRVGEMLPGVIYILRQGSIVKKYIAR